MTDVFQTSKISGNNETTATMKTETNTRRTNRSKNNSTSNGKGIDFFASNRISKSRGDGQTQFSVWKRASVFVEKDS